MKLHYLGTCSGTEPMAGMHHCSFILESDGALYWFDAGENCSHTAFTSGLDVTRTEALFLSHPHIDHMGGLANLFFCLDKVIWRYQKKLANGNRLEAFYPDETLFAAAKTLALCGVYGNFRFTLGEHRITDGVIFEDRNLRVQAMHNLHMGEPDDGNWRSYSFLLECEGKRVVYAGDIKYLDEITPLIGDGVDLLIMESGHHKVRDICEYAVSHGVRRLRFNHHGREILGDRAAAEGLLSQYEAAHPISMRLCYDGMTEIL